MKKLFAVLAATLVCGAGMLTSCGKDKEDGNQNITEQLVGKWLYIEADGEEVETSESSVTTFVIEGTTLKAYTSISLQEHGLWAYNQPTEVTVDGNKLTLTMHKDDITTVEEFSNISVSGDDLRYTCMYKILRSGEVIEEMGPYQLRCVKVHEDYSQIIIGHWEGTITSDEPGYVPQPFCEEYRADGKNIAYNLIDGQWVKEESEYGEYFVDGNLMCARWKLSGREEERENCIFMSYVDNVLTLKEVVLRNGHLYTETSTLHKVSK